jgi:hypothetical protein
VENVSANSWDFSREEDYSIAQLIIENQRYIWSGKLGAETPGELSANQLFIGTGFC